MTSGNQLYSRYDEHRQALRQQLTVQGTARQGRDADGKLFEGYSLCDYFLLTITARIAKTITSITMTAKASQRKNAVLLAGGLVGVGMVG